MLERVMSEGQPAPRTAIARIPTSEISGGTPPPDSRTERAPTPERRTAQLMGFNALFKFYEDANRPLWDRLEKGEELSGQERKDAIGYKITLDGIERLTQEPHRLGEAALPDTLAGDEFANTYVAPDGRTRKQREGLVTNHMTKWAQGEIDGGNTNAALQLSREIVWENSLPYRELHTTPGSINEQDRIRQEAGDYIHDTGEGPEGRNRHGVKVRDSRHPQGTEEHALEDWVTAEGELGEREEYIIDPPLPTDAVTFVNPPKIVLDPDAEPRDIHIPDRVENGPIRPGRVRGRSSDEEVRQWVVDLGGGVRTVGRVNVTNEYRVPAERAMGSESGEPVTVRDAEPGEDTRISENPADSEGSDRAVRGSLLRATSYPGAPSTVDTSFEGVTGRTAADTVREFDGSIREARSGPSDGVPPRVAPGFANEPGVRRGSHGELLPPEPSTDGVPTREDGRGLGDTSGAFYPEGDPRRYERPDGGVGSEAPEGPEDAEAKIGKRAERLARLKGIAGNLWKRVWGNNERVAPDDDWLKARVEPDLDPGTPRKGIGRWVALALVVAAVTATCVKPPEPGASSKPEPLPGNQYPPIERIVDRPQLTSVVEADPSLAPVAGNRTIETKPVGGFEGGGGKGVATVERDLSFAGEKQSVKGTAEDELAQLLNPGYKAHVEALSAQRKSVDATEGWSKGTLDAFKAKLVEKYGEQEAAVKYEKIIKDLTDQEHYVIENYNGAGGSKVGIGEDQDTIIHGPNWDGKLQLLDMDKEGKITVIMGMNGGSYSLRDDQLLNQYMVNFRPGDNNGQ